MRANIQEVRRVLPQKITIERRGEVSTRPRYSFEQRIELQTVPAPNFDCTYPLPEFYTWDNSKEEEQYAEIHIRTLFSREVCGVNVLEVDAKQWIKRGHIWREITINGELFTEEIWYKEGWHGHELHKDIWIEWNRNDREEVHVTEMDGLRIRYFFRKAKEDMNEPPGYFWYREARAQLSEAGKLWRLALVPEAQSLSERGWGQDLGYHKWPSDVWLKYWYDGKRLWTIKEFIRGNTIERHITVETKRLKLP